MKQWDKTLKELGYSIDYAKLDAANVYDTASIVLPLMQWGKVVQWASLSIDASKRSFYMVGNVQCGCNETFAFVPNWKAKITIPGVTPDVPVPPPSDKKVAGGSLQFAQEVLTVNNITRGFALGAGVWYQEWYYNPSSTPLIDKNGKPIWASTPNINTWAGTPIDPTKPSWSTSAPTTWWFGSGTTTPGINTGSGTPATTWWTNTSSPTTWWSTINTWWTNTTQWWFVSNSTTFNSGQQGSIPTIVGNGRVSWDLNRPSSSRVSNWWSVEKVIPVVPNQKPQEPSQTNETPQQSVEVDSDVTELRCVIKGHVLTILDAAGKPVEWTMILWKDAAGKQFTWKTDTTW
jgi:hypothetical protein